MKPKKTKTTIIAKLHSKFGNAETKLSLPLALSAKKPSKHLTTASSRVTPPAVSTLFIRPNSLPFNNASSLTSTVGLGTSDIQISQRVPEPQAVANTPSTINPTHAVNEQIAFHTDDGFSQQASKPTPRVQQRRKRGWTYEEARTALSLNNVVLNPKVNVARSDPRAKVFKKTGAGVRITKFKYNIAGETADTNRLTTKKIRFADEIPVKSTVTASTGRH